MNTQTQDDEGKWLSTVGLFYVGSYTSVCPNAESKGDNLRKKEMRKRNKEKRKKEPHT